jgi:hypothetical protein
MRLNAADGKNRKLGLLDPHELRVQETTAQAVSARVKTYELFVAMLPQRPGWKGTNLRG